MLEVSTQLKILLTENTLASHAGPQGMLEESLLAFHNSSLKDGKIWSKQKNWFFH